MHADRVWVTEPFGLAPVIFAALPNLDFDD